MVTFTLTDECGNKIRTTATFSVEETLSSSEFNQENLVLIPNPAKEYITIKGLHSIGKMSIYNLTGQKVLESEVINSRPLPINLFSGLYIVKITSDQKSITKKLIVE